MAKIEKWGFKILQDFPNFIWKKNYRFVGFFFLEGERQNFLIFSFELPTSKDMEYQLKKMQKNICPKQFASPRLYKIIYKKVRITINPVAGK